MTGKRSGRKSDEFELLYTVPQLAELWHVSERTVWRVIADGELEVHHIKNTVRITASSARRYLERVRR